MKVYLVETERPLLHMWSSNLRASSDIALFPVSDDYSANLAFASN